MLRVRKVFLRARKPDDLRALGIVLYHLGLSCWKVETVLEGFGGASHESVRRWYHRCRTLFDPPPRERRAVAVDETKVVVQGRPWYLWVAVDEDRPEVLASWVTPSRSSFEALQFLRAVVKRCTKPAPGPGGPGALVEVGPREAGGLPWEHQTFRDRGSVERWFGIFKQRAKLFWKRWPSNAKPGTPDSWYRAFVALYNLRGSLS